MQQAGKMGKGILSEQVAKWGFFVSLLVFICLKIPALSLPYFWDELGVYAPGALYMFDHGPGLLPASLDPEYSRGHPLLFYFLSSCTFRIFGPTILVAHLFALSISVLFLLVIFYFMRRWTNSFWAWMSAILLMAQPLFFAQSSLLLPEMLLALCIFLSLAFWINQKRVWYAIFSFLAIMTKETAVILPLVVLMFEMYQWWDTGKKPFILRTILIACVPWFAMTLFTIIQKEQHGWYFFPYHMDLMTISIQNMLNLGRDFGNYLFYAQGRWVYSLFLILGLVLMIWKRKELPSPAKAFPVALLVVLGGLSYSTLVFYMGRYTLFIIPFIILTGIFIWKELAVRWPRLLWILPLLFLSGLPFMQVKHFRYDTDMGYVRLIKSSEEVMDYTLSQLKEGETVFANFPHYYCLLDARLGYYPTTSSQSVLTGDIKKADWVIHSTIGPPLKEFFLLEDMVADTSFRVVYSDILLYHLKEEL